MSFRPAIGLRINRGLECDVYRYDRNYNERMGSQTIDLLVYWLFDLRPWQVDVQLYHHRRNQQRLYYTNGGTSTLHSLGMTPS